MRIVCISDTHGSHGKVQVPDGDVLIHAGDFMQSGKDYREVKHFAEWLDTLPHKVKIVIAGNHDRMFEWAGEQKDFTYYADFANMSSLSMRTLNSQIAKERLLKSAIYLEDSGVEVDGIKFWGSPYTPFFLNWAFNVPRGELHKHWDFIPGGTDVLITHGPAYGVLDTVRPGDEHLGCEELRHAVGYINPSLHVCGHIHGGYGKDQPHYGGVQTVSVNAAVVNEEYQVVNEPIVVDL